MTTIDYLSIQQLLLTRVISTTGLMIKSLLVVKNLINAQELKMIL